MDKRIIFTHRNPLLENIQLLESTQPENYAGFVYLWKCIPENMFYIGSHKGKVYDDYRGSGTRFRHVFEYYGSTQFERVILEYVSETDTIKAREQYWMTKFNAAKSQMFYNMRNTYNRKTSG